MKKIDKRTKITFIKKLRHNIRNPMNSVIGFSELLNEESENLGIKSIIDQLEEIQSSGYKIVNYIKEGISKIDLLTICEFLDIKPINIIRTSDQYYKDLKISSEDMNKDEFLLDIIVKNPKILQRPIFINGNKAIIGRPPERVLDIL